MGYAIHSRHMVAFLHFHLFGHQSYLTAYFMYCLLTIGHSIPVFEDAPDDFDRFSFLAYIGLRTLRYFAEECKIL